MSKLTTWLVTGLLLVYFIFTSGFVYWVSGCEVTDELITPFSWSLSADKGFTPIATEGDIDCIHWLLYESNPDIQIIADSSEDFLLTGYMEILTGASLGADISRDRIEAIWDIFTLDQCYLFHTDWNSRNDKHVACSDVGLKSLYPFKLENKEDGYPLYSTCVPKWENSRTIYVPATIQVQVKEVFRSGNSVVYEKLANINE